MTTPVTVSGTTPAPKSLIARFIGVLTSPRDTFASVAAHPKWFGMLAMTTLIVALFTALPLTTEAGKQATLDMQIEQMKSMGFPPSEEMYEGMEKGKGSMPYTTGLFVVVLSPILALIVAGILFAIFNAAMGGEASFKQVFAVVAHAGGLMCGAVFSVSSILLGSINFARGTALTSVANLGAVFPMLPEGSFMANLLGAADVFMIWYIVVLAIGLGVLYKRRTQPIAISLLSVYVVIAIAVALFKSRGGGA